MAYFAGLRENLKNRRALIVLICLVLVLICVALVSADKGSVEITQSQILAITLKKIGIFLQSDFNVQQEATLVDIRLPRIVLGALVGAALGISGAAMQGIFRNPLADPSLIGISSGAALAATMVVVIGDAVSFSLPAIFQLFAFPAAAFIGALITTLIIYRMATIGGQTVVATLLLAGISINALAQSFSGFLTFYATDTQIRSLTFWKLGSLGGGNWSSVAAAMPFILIPILLFLRLARPLNALLLGESEAGHLGFEVEKVKRQAVVLVALAVGASVAFTGLITFVGLIVPHLLRLIIGPDHRYLFPASALLGASLLLTADLIARTLVAPAEMPIGVLTAMLGAPFFFVAAAARRAEEFEKLIAANQISVRVKSKEILKKISLELRSGEIFAVIGQNGAGKSSLLKVLCGDRKPASGEVSMNDVPLENWKANDRARIRAVLPQDSAFNFPFTAAEVVLMGRAPHLRGSETARDFEIVEAALAAFGVEDLKERIYPTLSGGERQRVHLARVAAQIWESVSDQPRYLFLDEPVSSLDLAHQHQTLKTVKNFARENVGVFLILHDLNLTAQYADRVLVLKEGKLLAIDTPEKIFTPEMIRAAFGVEAAVSKHPFFDCPLIVTAG